MPTDGSADAVEDDVVLVEEEVGLDVLTKALRKSDALLSSWSWSRPNSAFPASLDDFRNLL